MVSQAQKIYRPYYTKSAPIVDFMVEKLALENGAKVLEPCAGDGVFVDALKEAAADILLDIYELNPQAAASLKEKYQSQDHISVNHEDTLTSQTLGLLANAGGAYDRIIANPPYGAWQDYDKRAYLKKLYAGLYVKETYALFLYLCIRLLRDEGILVFIIPDTFLNLHRHTKLREFLLRTTCVKEISLFPSSFFPGVNFGYANLCIITLQRCLDENQCLSNEINVVTGFKSAEELSNLKQGMKAHHKEFRFKQSDIYENLDHALFISEDDKIVQLINRNTTRICDVADCVTGFYSGDDKKYLHSFLGEHKSAKNYAAVDRNLIFNEPILPEQLFVGINTPEFFVPIVKGGGVKYFKPDRWFMDWSVEAVNHYKSDKKARFQNAQFYFKRGIGVPMVSSASLSAALIENKLFDQSIVGVFPKEPGWLYYLLAFFNSPTCNKLIRTINPTANNPANYIKKIPFVSPSEETLKEINENTEKILLSLKSGKDYSTEYEARSHSLIQEIYGF